MTESNELVVRIYILKAVVPGNYFPEFVSKQPPNKHNFKNIKF